MLVAALIGINVVVGYRNLTALAGDYEWVSHTHEVRHEIDAVLTGVLESESAARAFILTGDEGYVVPYRTSGADANHHLDLLTRLTRDNPIQFARTRRLASLTTEKYSVLDRYFETRRSSGFNPAQINFLQDRGPQLMDQIRVLIAEMRAAETNLLRQRSSISRATYQITLRAGAVATLISLILLTVAYFLFWRTLMSERQISEAIESRRADLEEAVRRRTAELNEFSHELERSNRELEQFAFVASHDLQEPLRKIQTFSDRLVIKEGEALGPEGRDYLGRIISAATRMRTLIDDLLSFSRVHSRGNPFVEVDLAQVVKEVLVDLEAQIDQSGARVRVGPLPALEGDPLQMRQLFQNLIGNALKFRRPDVASVIMIEAETDDSKAPVLPPPDDARASRITVRDNGIGFDPDYAEKIFEVFQRLHGRSEYEGSGMGLAISRRIVERHGGRISAHSQPGEGAAFVIVLPITQTKIEG